MNANVALNFAPRAATRPARKASARKLVRARVVPTLRPVTARPAPLAPSAGARIEAVLMGITFVALAGLAVAVEAVGASLF